ncbi:hypothetical protein P879_04738 [Paragonimus westermani]|uniref:Uncharacterized protein n=1 Tax=Paragonimus westermani TaxID=34504 RepID=A0A8T0DD42_9TREM|nr:hypothetical protein P879_04738 [Paragonimus westermani]
MVTRTNAIWSMDEDQRSFDCLLKFNSKKDSDTANILTNLSVNSNEHKATNAALNAISFVRRTSVCLRLGILSFVDRVVLPTSHFALEAEKRCGI